MAEKARAAAQKALALDPWSADTLVALGFLELEVGWNWPAAERHIKGALELNPNHADAHVGYLSYLIFMARFPEGIAASGGQCASTPSRPHRA